MSARERKSATLPVPACMAALVEGRQWARNLVGEAGAAVYRLHRGDGDDLYLKHGLGLAAADVTDEMVRLRWLEAYLPVPRVHHFVARPEEAWLLTRGVPGRTAWQLLTDGTVDPTAITDALARFLRRLHAIPAEACPFNSDHRLRLGLARTRLDAGLVDRDDFDDAREGWSAQQVWDRMMALLPFDADPVVTHGDYSLDNILLVDRAVVGCIDVGRAGIADRYQDVAIAWNCLKEFGPDMSRRFLKAYGLSEPDERKLEFHLALDEFF